MSECFHERWPIELGRAAPVIQRSDSNEHFGVCGGRSLALVHSGFGRSGEASVAKQHHCSMPRALADPRQRKPQSALGMSNATCCGLASRDREHP